MNKKGDLTDGVYFIVVMLALAIIFIVGNLIVTQFNTHFQESDVISPIGKQITADLTARYVGVLDGAFLAFFVGIALAIIIGAFFIRTHPALFWLSIPILAFFVFLAAIYANFFENFIQNEQIAASAADFTMLTFIMNNYMFMVMVIIMVVAVAIFAKNKTGNI